MDGFPSIKPVGEMPESLRTDLRSKGFWECHRFTHPPCLDEPVAEVTRDDGDGKIVRSIYCQKHLEEWCKLKGFDAPDLSHA